MNDRSQGKSFEDGAVDWARIHMQLKLAEWHLDAAASASQRESALPLFERGRAAYEGAMAALETATLTTAQENALRERLQNLSLRLRMLERGC